MTILNEGPRAGKFMQTENRMELTRGWREGEGELLFNRHRVFGGDSENVFRCQWWWIHNIVNVFNATEVYTHE